MNKMLLFVSLVVVILITTALGQTRKVDTSLDQNGSMWSSEGETSIFVQKGGILYKFNKMSLALERWVPLQNPPPRN